MEETFQPKMYICMSVQGLMPKWIGAVGRISLSIQCSHWEAYGFELEPLGGNYATFCANTGQISLKIHLGATCPFYSSNIL